MKWLHNLLKGLSLTTALFIFQACYGTPEWLHEEDLPFKVMDALTGDPLEGVSIRSRVTAADNLDWIPAGMTDANGEAIVHFGISDGFTPQFRIDATGQDYLIKDTVLTDMSYHVVEIRLTKVE